MTCAYCASTLLTLLGQLGSRVHYRCRLCGADSSAIVDDSPYVELGEPERLRGTDREELIREEYAADRASGEYDNTPEWYYSGESEE